MGNVRSEAGLIRITLHHNIKTPEEFVVDLLCLDLRRPFADAYKAIDAAAKHGKAICGTYPRNIGTKMFEAAQKRIAASGHRLVLTSDEIADGSETPDRQCKLCSGFSSENLLTLRGVMTLVCDNCTSEITNSLPEVTRTKQFDHACDALNWHFAGIPHWSRPCGNFRVICAPTFRLPSTNCSRRRHCVFSASMNSIVTRR
jgi:ATP-dependent Clp protease adapter protein ClpS